MEGRSRFIKPERMGIWIVAALMVAMLAFLLAVKANRDVALLTGISQGEVVLLHKRIVALEAKQAQKAVQLRAESQPAQPAPEAATPAPALAH
jgi:hypothetical protein